MQFLALRPWLLALAVAAVSLPAAAAELRPPFATRGTEIVDRAGTPVVFRGISWFGMETDTHVPHGIWTRDYREMIAQIRGTGFDLVRIPFSVKAVRSTNVGGIDFGKGANATLQGLGPLEVLDRIVAEAARQGLFVLLDCHRLDDSKIPELWYDGTTSEADWLDCWRLMARRYGKAPNVIGADIKNEPHGAASWGTDDPKTDFRLAAERCGDAIHEIAPHWLIVVEGVEKNVPGQQLPGHWWGGNLEGVRRFPVRLKRKDRLVYSPHEYGPGVHQSEWFRDPAFPANMPDRWQKGFHYIVDEGIAPILVGEFGGRQTGGDTTEGVWQRTFVEFLREKNLGFIYWCWNPNGGDTGGMVADDWLTIVQPKRDLLAPLLDRRR